MIALRDTPMAKHYRAAELELHAWANNGGDPVTPSLIDMHVLSQLTDFNYLQLDRMDMFEYQPLLEELLLVTMMPSGKVIGNGPWTINVCSCCVSGCGLLCFCEKECTCGPDKTPNQQELFRFRPMKSRDLHVVAVGRQMQDTYKRAELLTGKPVDDMPYGEFRLLDMAINRSISNPFWPRGQGAFPSTPGVTSNDSSTFSPEEGSSPESAKD